MASTLQVTITNLNGDVVFGPESLGRTMTVAELKHRFFSDKKKKLATQDGNFLANNDTLDSLPAEVCLSMVLDREPTVVQASRSWFASNYRQVDDSEPAEIQTEVLLDRHKVFWDVDRELQRKVYQVDGVFWFHVTATASLEDGGTYSVGFRLKRTEDLSFNVPIILMLNGVEQRRVRFEEELLTDGRWSVLHVGDFETAISGTVQVQAEMKGTDCSDAGRVSKRGLLIDHLVCLPI